MAHSGIHRPAFPKGYAESLVTTDGVQERNPIGWDDLLGESMMWDFGRLPFTYCGGGAPEERGSKRHDVFNLLPMRNLLLLDTAGSDEEGDEDTYTTSSTGTPEL